jgi:hypothetical protein
MTKIQRFIDNFAGQWLLLRNLLGDGQDGGKSKDPIKKAAGLNGLSPEVRQAMFDEGTGLVRPHPARWLQSGRLHRSGLYLPQ